MVKNWILRILSCLIAILFVFSTSPFAYAITAEGSQSSATLVESSAKTTTARATKKTALKITKQPSSVTVKKGKTAKISFIASGDGLKYYWYYKNAGDKKYTRTSSFTSNTYSVTMNKERSERKVYCLVKDKYGNSAKTDVVTLYMGTPLKITKQPVSVAAASGKTAKVSFTANGDGLRYYWYYKNVGDSKFTRTKSFTSNSYSVTMSNARKGRQVYCVVKDKYGNSVKTDVVTLFKGAILKITKQPSSVSVHNGETAKVSFTASGNGLKYRWYYKDANKTSYSRTKTFTKNYYNAEMNYKRDGRKIYCVVEDKYGNTVKTNTVTLSSSHKLGSWEIYREATAAKEGIERRYCSECSYYNDRSVAKLPAAYYITVNLGASESYKFPVAKDGKYKLDYPSRDGYTFDGFKDANGNDFPIEGTISKNTTITAVWGLDGTNTLQQLVKRTNAGVETIVITSDIILTQPIYISYNTTIYSDGDHSITRAPDYTGDMFVVGLTKDGKSATTLHRQAQLTLGGGTGMLTIDGNRDNVTGTVNGSAVFVCESATLNLYDGVSIINNIKSGNERAFKFNEYISDSTAERAGGAAILNINATVNMYGGLIDNNLISTEHTIVKNEDGTETWYETNGCGAGVYNRGLFYMYGGTISNSEGLRGGGLYNDRVVYLVSGTISDNIAHYYGAAVASSSGQNAELHIGSEGEGETMLFKNNHSIRAGGALYSNTSSPIIIYGNTEFVNNSSESSGGAIYTAGPLTISDTLFEGNSCVYSGGAIYHFYTKAEFTRRFLTLTNCEFKGNNANLGGAVILSASDTVSSTNKGTYATITDCKFEENKANSLETANGNGGALYITRKSEAIIDGCIFNKNSADVNAGAVAIHSNSKVDMTNCEFNENSANLGGAMYTSSNATVDLKNIKFNSNSARLDAKGSGGNGGAHYLYEANVTYDNVDFTGNHADNHAGAVYQGISPLTIDSSCEFNGNTAGNHGGAFYLTYKTLTDGTRQGAVLNATDVSFKNNSAMAGGAISIRSSCEGIINGGEFIENSVAGYLDKNDGDGEGGGAIYVGYGKLTLTDVTATSNSASDFGGFVDSAGSTVTINGGTFTGNKSYSGGALFATSTSDVTITNATLKENESVYENTDYNSAIGGGALYQKGGSLAVSNCVLDGNKSEYYAGAIYANNAQVTINENTVVKNSQGATGAAIYLKGSTTADLTDITITDNVSSSNGVVYVNYCTLNMTNVTATKNKAYQGGVIYSSNSNAKVNLTNCTVTENNATNGGVVYFDSATVTLNGGTFTGNTAKNGGVAYSLKGNLIVNPCEINNNSATGNGGAIYISEGTATIKDIDIHNHHANSNGGALYLYLSTATLDNVKFNKNVANSNGGAIDIVGSNVTAINNCQFNENTATNHAGAVYVTYTKPEGATENINGTFNITDGIFSKNTALGGGAVSVRTGCEATFNGTTFTENSVTGYADKNDGNGEGGGAIYVGYGKLTLTNVTATNNTASDFGGAIDAVDAEVIINGGTFSENTTVSGGAIYAITKSELTITNATFNNNSASYGGAISLSSSNADVEKCAFQNNSACLGGAIQNTKGILNFTDSSFSENQAKKDTNGANGNGGAIVNTAGTITIAGDTAFKKNTSENHGGAIYVSYTNNDDGTKNPGILNVTGGLFEENSAVAGGAISERTACETTLNGTILKKNSATGTTTSEGGGAIYAGYSNSLTLTGVTLEENSTNYYGGAVNAPGTNVTINGKSVINNNSGITGVALYFRDGGNCVLDNISVTNNVATTDGSGVIYITGAGSLTINALTATGNYNNNGGVIYASGNAKISVSNSSLSNNTAKNLGGAIDFRSSGASSITNTIIEGNTSKKGAAINVAGTGELTINGCTIKNNIASDKGGAIFTENKSKINVSENTLFEGNSALTGGAAYIDGGAKLTIDKAIFDANTATGGEGGAILVADTTEEEKAGTTLIATGTTFRNNTASTKGGAISTDTASATLVINVSDCIFEKNSAIGAGGGAVEIQNANQTNATDPTELKIVFTNCTFNENTCKTTGAAIEIRTSSAAKIDSITATNNKTTQNGAVIYLTSNFSRLYLTGTVTTNGNSAANGNFAYLYNSNYTNPPKIYTTHSSSATWYSDVAGNKTSVEFDYSAMP